MFLTIANPCHLTYCVIMHFCVLMMLNNPWSITNLHCYVFSASFLCRNQPVRNNEPPSSANLSNALPGNHRQPTIIAPPSSDVLVKTAPNIPSNRIFNPSSTMREPANRHSIPRPPVTSPEDILSENCNLSPSLSCWNCGQINFY